MEIHLTPNSNFAEIWLTRTDQQDADCMAALPSVLAELKGQKRLPVIIRSGTGSLYDCTLGLLAHNRTENLKD